MARFAQAEKVTVLVLPRLAPAPIVLVMDIQRRLLVPAPLTGEVRQPHHLSAPTLPLRVPKQVDVRHAILR